MAGGEESPPIFPCWSHYHQIHYQREYRDLLTKGKNNRRWNNGLQNGKWERRVANNTEILLNPSKIIPEIMKHAPGVLWAKEKKGIETKLGGVTVSSQKGEGKGGKSLLVALSRPSSQLVRQTPNSLLQQLLEITSRSHRSQSRSKSTQRHHK